MSADIWAGLAVVDATATVEESVVSDTEASYEGIQGGVVAACDADPATSCGLTLRRTLVERNLEFGIVTQGARLTLEDTVVRETGPSSDLGAGRGIELENIPSTGAPPRPRCAASSSTATSRWGCCWRPPAAISRT